MKCIFIKSFCLPFWYHTSLSEVGRKPFRPCIWPSVLLVLYSTLQRGRARRAAPVATLRLTSPLRFQAPSSRACRDGKGVVNACCSLCQTLEYPYSRSDLGYQFLPRCALATLSVARFCMVGSDAALFSVASAESIGTPTSVKRSCFESRSSVFVCSHRLELLGPQAWWLRQPCVLLALHCSAEALSQN